MANYQVDLPQFAKPSDSLTLGERYGTAVGRIFSGVGSAIDQSKAKQQEEANKAKIDSFLMAYNNPNDATIFSGLKGSMRAEKLSRLLLPLDRKLSEEYARRADEMKKTDAESEKLKLEAQKKAAELAEKKTAEMAEKDATQQRKSVELMYNKYIGLTEKIPMMDVSANPVAVDVVKQQAQALKDALMQDPYGVELLGQFGDVVDNKLDPSAVETTIKNAKDELPRDGEIDGYAEIVSAIESWGNQNRLSPKDPMMQSLYKVLEAKKESISDAFQKAESKRLEGKGTTEDIEKRAEKVIPVYGVYKRLKENPNDIATRGDAMNRLLRDESGAAIGKDEVISRLQTILPTNEYENLVSETGGIKGWVANSTGNENLLNIQVMSKYLGKMDVQKMCNILKDRVGGQKVFDYLEKTYKTDEDLQRSKKPVLPLKGEVKKVGKFSVKKRS